MIYQHLKNYLYFNTMKKAILQGGTRFKVRQKSGYSYHKAKQNCKIELVRELKNDYVYKIAEPKLCAYRVRKNGFLIDESFKQGREIYLSKKDWKPYRTDYSRDELIEICKQAIDVPVTQWCNRDSQLALGNVDEIYALLKSGAEYEITNETDENTIWLKFHSVTAEQFEKAKQYSLDFPSIDEYWELHEDVDTEMFEYQPNWRHGDEYQYFGGYLPTPKRLKEREGMHWY